jgi:uncharacterized protein (DUF885 family)
LTRLEELADELVDVLAEEDPLNELLQGYPGYEHLLPNPDEAAGQALRTRALRIAGAAAGCAGDPATRGLVIDQARAVATRVDARLIEHTMADFSDSPLAVLLTKLPDCDDGSGAFLERLAGVPAFLASAIDRHRAGLAAGRLPVASRVAAAIADLDAYLADPAADPLAGADRERLLETLVRPAFAGYRALLYDELAPRGRSDDRPGLCWLPDGAATYAALAAMHTTTARPPEELHRTGLGLIEALAEEYVELGGPLFGVRTAGEVHERMRTLRFTTEAEILAVCRAAMDRAEAAAQSVLGRLPAHPCGLEPVPALRAASASSAAYAPGPLDGSRAGVFHINTNRPAERDRCVVEANVFHETVPGHHVQISLAQELTGVPLLRRVAWVNSYMEGWALYSERLADELGLYSDGIARLGMLANDSMRSARLVVDTGLHHYGWSRQRVVDYLRANTVMSEVEIQSETDRYIESPGQALSYMVGRLELRRIRDGAAQALGTAFDLRAFHDVVLGGGPLPMAVLDEVVRAWVAAA